MFQMENTEANAIAVLANPVKNGPFAEEQKCICNGRKKQILCKTVSAQEERLEIDCIGIVDA